MKSSELLREHLQKNSFLSGSELDTICSHFYGKRLEKEEALFKKGEQFPFIVFAAEGILRSHIYDDEGEEIVKHFISEGDFFSEIDSFEHGKPAAFNITAVTACRLDLLPRSASDELSELIPKWDSIMHSEAVKAMNAMIRNREFLSLGDSGEKYHYFVHTYPHLARHVPLKYIAAYLQITQSSLSRIRRRRD